MAMKPKRSLFLPWFGMFLLALAAAGAGAAPAEPSAQNAGFNELWGRFQSELDQARPNQAFTLAAKIYQQALSQNADGTLAQALFEMVRLKVGVYQYEQALDLLYTYAFPEDPATRGLLLVFRAFTLRQYYQAYRWEILNRRGKAETTGFREWTARQIWEAADSDFRQAWNLRRAMGRVSQKEYARFLRPGDFPPDLRPTLRDFLAHAWADFLADQETWSPQASEAAGELNPKTLMENGRPAEALDVRAHPLQRLAAVYADLAAWHAAAARENAALDARLSQVLAVQAALGSAAARREAVSILRALAGRTRALHGWAYLQYQLAVLLRSAGNLAEAVRAARAGAEAYPYSQGGKLCAVVAAHLEAPAFSLKAELLNPPGGGRLLCTHRNLRRIQVRVYSVPPAVPEKLDLAWTDGEIRELLQHGVPVRELDPALTDRGQYEEEQDVVALHLEAPGWYLAVASAQPGFPLQENKIEHALLIVSGIGLVTRADREGQALMYCLDARSGRPAPGARISLYAQEWEAGRRTATLAAEGEADEQGLFVVSVPEAERRRLFRAVARQGDNLCVDPGALHIPGRVQPPARQLFIYTDRPVYRPGQKVQFKIIALSTPNSVSAYAVTPGIRVKLKAVDPNGETVAAFDLSTNAWGSASASFILPANRLLGRYRLLSADAHPFPAHGGGFRVEEYRLPKFTVEVQESKAAWRLNRPAQVQGTARYYAGGPVPGGRVQYQVTRAPIFPYGFGWLFPPEPRTVTVASGETDTDGQGGFSVDFVPLADETLPGGEDVIFAFTVHVTVTDPGGDSVAQDQTFRIGRASRKATIEVPSGYAVAGRDFSLTVRLTDLDDRPQAGAGNLEIFPLRPAPPDSPENWSGDLARRDLVRELAALPRGGRTAQVALRHGDGGLAATPEMRLPVGAYALEYRSHDAFGQEVSARQVLLVAPPEGAEGDLPAPLVLAAARTRVPAGEQARFLLACAWPGQTVFFEVQRNGRTIQRQIFSGLKARQVSFPVTGDLRGGFTAKLFTLHAYRFYQQSVEVDVPWDDRDLNIEFRRFREVIPPGGRETFTLAVKAPDHSPARAEVLAWMVDQALEYYRPQQPPDIRSLLPGNQSAEERWADEIRAGRALNLSWLELPHAALPEPARFRDFEYYVAAGPQTGAAAGRTPEGGGPVPALLAAAAGPARARVLTRETVPGETLPVPPVRPLRREFQETAFFEPQLACDEQGEVSITFTAPEALTAWKLGVVAHGRGLLAGSAVRSLRTQKEFMVRTYVPRFLREGDRILLRAGLESSSPSALAGEAVLRVLDESGAEVTSAFQPDRTRAAWELAPGGNSVVAFSLRAPPGLKIYRVQLSARSGNFSDGEERPLPVLAGRGHFITSRFAVLKGQVEENLKIEPLLQAGQDPNLVQDSLVITLDARWLDTLLGALPYLQQYPYACVEQTLNRFASLALLHNTLQKYPALKKAAHRLAARKTALAPWDRPDPNRRLLLEETPWLRLARGGGSGEDWLGILDPGVLDARAQATWRKLAETQNPDGGFPWFPGGPSHFYLTLYVLEGLAPIAAGPWKPPEAVVDRAWDYCASHYREQVENRQAGSDRETDWHLSVYLNYVLSAYARTQPAGIPAAFNREQMLADALAHWRQLSPYGRAMLALTLHRARDTANAARVLNSLLDIAQTTEAEGTYWAPEPKAWLWYNDTIESQAFILRALLEIKPDDPRVDGVALWLLRHKQGNQWKSTRATAAALAALADYQSLRRLPEGTERVEVVVPPLQKTLTWKPGEVRGRRQLALAGEEITPASGDILFRKTGRGPVFATATWQFATDRMPAAGSGDVLQVARKIYRVVRKGRQTDLERLGPDSPLRTGDELEVELDLRARVPLEFIQVCDPRGAGFEPEEKLSGYHGGGAAGYYQEIRDSVTNFFFDALPQGQYTLRYRVRAAGSGTFRIAPATVQSLYAPEFGAYSSGAVFTVGP